MQFDHVQTFSLDQFTYRWQ